MSELHSLRVTSRTRSVTEDVHRIFSRLNKGGSCTVISACFHDFIKRVSLNLLACSCRFQCVIYSITHDQSTYKLCHTLALHANDFLGVVRCADDSFHLSLIENEVNLLGGHSIVKAHRGHVVVHASQQSCCPLPAVLGPHTTEVPISVFSTHRWTEA